MIVLLIRHAHSKANEAKNSLKSQINPEKPISTLKAELKTAQLEHLLDPGLTGLGIQQCVNFKNNNRTVLDRAKYIFVSPLSRCLETLAGLLDGHAFKARGGRIMVLPELMAKASSQWNVPFRLRENLQKFPFIETANIESQLEQFKEFIFLDWINEEKLSKEIEQGILKNPDVADDQARIERFREVLRKRIESKRPIESNTMFFRRVQKIKKYIKQFMSVNKVEPGELLIIGHKKFCKFFTCCETENDSNLGNSGKCLGNCEIFRFQI